MTDETRRNRASRLGEEEGEDYKEMVVYCIDCRVDITISGWAVLMATMANRFCSLNGWERLKKNEIARCDKCTKTFRRDRERHVNMAVDFMKEVKAAVIRGDLMTTIDGMPEWFKREYSSEVANLIANKNKYSSRKKPKQLSID